MWCLHVLMYFLVVEVVNFPRTKRVYSLARKRQVVDLYRRLREDTRIIYQDCLITSTQQIANIFGVANEKSIREWVKQDLSDEGSRARLIYHFNLFLI